jgi:hypothetical protein
VLQGAGAIAQVIDDEPEVDDIEPAPSGGPYITY